MHKQKGRRLSPKASFLKKLLGDCPGPLCIWRPDPIDAH
jgi:hypothetical protein